MSKKVYKDERLSLRVSAFLKDRLEAIANERHQRLSTVLEQALMEYVENHGVEDKVVLRPGTAGMAGDWVIDKLMG